MRLQEFRDGAAVEQSTLDRSALKHSALDAAQGGRCVPRGARESSPACCRLLRRGRRRAWRASARRRGGCPRPRRRCDRGAPDQRPRRPSAPRSDPRTRRRSRGRATRGSYAAGVPPRTVGRRRGRGARGRGAGSGRRSRSRGRTRAGRAAPARPSGCRPPRRREVARQRASRRAVGTPTRFPPESLARRSPRLRP